MSIKKLDRETRDLIRECEDQVQKKEEAHMKKGHSRPVTRREMLASGILGMSAYALAPTALSMLFRSGQAFGAEAICPPETAGTGLVPLLSIDCAGGANLGGNFLIKDRNSAFLNSYSQRGCGSINTDVTPDMRFGLAMAGVAPGGSRIGNVAGGTVISPFLQSLITFLTPAEMARVRFAAIPNQSQDDTRNNPHSPTHLLQRGGLKGSLMSSGLSDQNTLSGGSAQAPGALAIWKPTAINGAADLVGKVSYGRAFGATRFPAGVLQAMVDASLRLTVEQQANLASAIGGDTAAIGVQCGIKKNRDFTSPATAFDPQDPTGAQGVPAIIKTSAAISQTSIFNYGDAADRRISAIMYNAAKGNVGPATITLSGCDYHDNNRTNGDTKDAEIGMRFAQWVKTLVALNKRGAAVIFSDGSTSTNTNTRIYTGDNSAAGVTIMAFIETDPNAFTNASNLFRNQIGFYTGDANNQGTDRTNSFAGSDPALATYVAVANWLAFSVGVGNFQNAWRTAFSAVQPAKIAVASNLNQYLFFAS